ncbi:unnamed protein product, partial [Effrenium voratum]
MCSASAAETVASGLATAGDLGEMGWAASVKAAVLGLRSGNNTLAEELLSPGLDQGTRVGFG